MAWIHDPLVPCNAKQDLLDIISMAFDETSFSYDKPMNSGSLEWRVAQRAVNCAGAPKGWQGLSLQDQCDHVAQAKVEATAKQWLFAINQLDAAGGGGSAPAAQGPGAGA